MTRESLRGRVAVVTGASRGAGRGIAVELGAAGATVYVTARTSRETGAPPTYGRMLAALELEQMPGTIEATADEVTAAGGVGIAVRCDHGRADEVQALFAQVHREQGRLDLLVNNAWGGHETLSPDLFEAPFWAQPLEHWEGMFHNGVRTHLVTAHEAAPWLVEQRHGLVISTTFWDRDRYLRGNLFYDLAKATLGRLAFGLAEELRPHGVAALALSPGFMRTELVLAHMHTDEAHFRDCPALAHSESPRYLGRAVCALAGDPDVLQRSGRTLRVAELAREYGFTDLDGSQPPPFELL